MCSVIQNPSQMANLSTKRCLAACFRLAHSKCVVSRIILEVLQKRAKDWFSRCVQTQLKMLEIQTNEEDCSVRGDVVLNLLCNPDCIKRSMRNSFSGNLPQIRCFCKYCEISVFTQLNLRNSELIVYSAI